MRGTGCVRWPGARLPRSWRSRRWQLRLAQTQRSSASSTRCCSNVCRTRTPTAWSGCGRRRLASVATAWPSHGRQRVEKRPGGAQHRGWRRNGREAERGGSSPVSSLCGAIIGTSPAMRATRSRRAAFVASATQNPETNESELTGTLAGNCPWSTRWLARRSAIGLSSPSS